MDPWNRRTDLRGGLGGWTEAGEEPESRRRPWTRTTLWRRPGSWGWVQVGTEGKVGHVRKGVRAQKELEDGPRGCGQGT